MDEFVLKEDAMKAVQVTAQLIAGLFPSPEVLQEELSEIKSVELQKMVVASALAAKHTSRLLHILTQS